MRWQRQSKCPTKSGLRGSEIIKLQQIEFLREEGGRSETGKKRARDPCFWGPARLGEASLALRGISRFGTASVERAQHMPASDLDSAQARWALPLLLSQSCPQIFGTPYELLGGGIICHGHLPRKSPKFSGCARKPLPAPPDLQKNHWPCILEGHFSTTVYMFTFNKFISNWLGFHLKWNRQYNMKITWK